MSKVVIFYASTKTKKMFSLQGFYRTDIDILKNLGYKVILSNRIYDFFCFWRYNIAFIYFYRYGFFAGLIAKIMRRKVYFTGGIDHLNKEFTDKSAFILQKIFFLLCYFISDKNILVSRSDRENINKLFPYLRSKRFVLIEHSINTNIYSPKIETKREKLIVTIAWMLSVENVVRKGVDKSIYIFSELLQLDSSYRMYVVGPIGLGTQYLKEIVETLKIEDYITFTGIVDEQNKIKLLRSSAVYIQVSNYEGFGLAAIEALACGCLVIHSNVGGLQWCVGANGIIVNPINDSYQSIAKKIIDTLQNELYLKQLQLNAYSHLEKKYDTKVRIKAFGNVIGH